MGQIRVYINSNTMETNPTAQADAKCGYFLLRTILVNPYTDAPASTLPRDPKYRKGIDNPLFQGGHESAYITSPFLQINHDIGDALAGTMVGILPSTAGFVHGKSFWIQQIP